jgi:SAM domain (Sterile alpha motif)
VTEHAIRLFARKFSAAAVQKNRFVTDRLSDFTQGSLEEWLRILRLEEYGPGMSQQGYKTVEQAAQLAWEDLEDTGIVKLGHQKKILLAIKRVKDIHAGKRPLPGYPHQVSCDAAKTTCTTHITHTLYVIPFSRLISTRHVEKRKAAVKIQLFFLFHQLVPQQS